MRRESAAYLSQFDVVPTFRVGVHGGDVVVSEQGDTRRSIGVYGDTINIAARMEDAAKEHGVACVFSGDIAAAFDDCRGLIRPLEKDPDSRIQCHFANISQRGALAPGRRVREFGKALRPSSVEWDAPARQSGAGRWGHPLDHFALDAHRHADRAERRLTATIMPKRRPNPALPPRAGSQ
jgi:hypothetical protein